MLKNKDFSKQIESVRKIKEKDCQKSFSFLLDQYEPLLKSYTNYFKNKYPEIPADWDDIMNQLRADFYILIKKFDETKGKFFGSYIKEFLLLKTNSEIRKLSNKKYLTMNYAKFGADFELVSEESEKDFEGEIRALIKTARLTNLEKFVSDGLMKGFTMKELAEQKNLSIKSLYSARSRVITKLSKTNKTNI